MVVVRTCDISILPNPHPLNRRCHIRHSEPDGLAHFEVGDQSAHAPVVELAAADFQMAGKFLFGDQVEFGAQRRWESMGSVPAVTQKY